MPLSLTRSVPEYGGINQDLTCYVSFKEALILHSGLNHYFSIAESQRKKNRLPQVEMAVMWYGKLNMPSELFREELFIIYSSPAQKMQKKRESMLFALPHGHSRTAQIVLIWDLGACF